MMTRHWIALALACLGLAACGAKNAEGATPDTDQTRPSGRLSAEASDALMRKCAESTERLDETPKPDQAFLQEFAPGVVIKYPRCLQPGFDPKQVAQPAKAPAMSMIFSFPDMRIRNSVPGTIERYLQKQRGDYVAQRDRFPVYVVHMWYVAPDADKLVPGSLQPDYFMEPRPARMLLNSNCRPTGPGKCEMEVGRVRTTVPGLFALRSLEWIASHRGSTIDPLRQSGRYVTEPGSPFELLMTCSGVESADCDADVYSKKEHFQYRMVFPAEGVEQTRALLASIDVMLGKWKVR